MLMNGGTRARKIMASAMEFMEPPTELYLLCLKFLLYTDDIKKSKTVTLYFATHYFRSSPRYQNPNSIDLISSYCIPLTL